MGGASGTGFTMGMARGYPADVCHYFKTSGRKKMAKNLPGYLEYQNKVTIAYCRLSGGYLSLNFNA